MGEFSNAGDIGMPVIDEKFGKLLLGVGCENTQRQHCDIRACHPIGQEIFLGSIPEEHRSCYCILDSHGSDCSEKHLIRGRNGEACG